MMFCWAILCIEISCKKPDAETSTQELPPPNIIVSVIADVVGSGIDSLTLNSSAVYFNNMGGLPFSHQYEIRWACIDKPNGAPSPMISGQQQSIAHASGLVTGDYTFEVSYATKAGVKKSTLAIRVVPDFPTGAMVVRDDLEWKIDEQVIFPGFESAWTDWSNDPEHIYYRGLGRIPKVEYLNPVTNQWIQLSTGISSNTFHQPNGTAWINYATHTVSIKINEGFTWDWLMQFHPVRLTY